MRIRRTPRSTPVERLQHPEQWRPSPYTPVLDSADRAAARSRLDAYIDDAAARGALDEGNADYADSWIDAQVAGWRTALEEQTFGRTRAAADLLESAAAQQDRRAAEVEELTVRRARIAGQRDALATELGAAPAAALPEPEALPEAVVLTGHALRAVPTAGRPAPVRPIRPTDDDAGSAATAN